MGGLPAMTLAICSNSLPRLLLGKVALKLTPAVATPSVALVVSEASSCCAHVSPKTER